MDVVVVVVVAVQNHVHEKLAAVHTAVVQPAHQDAAEPDIQAVADENEQAVAVLEACLEVELVQMTELAVDL